MNNKRPDENWSLDRLGKFCSMSHKKMAVDAWRFGHALNLARAKHKSHGDWQKWKKQYVPELTHSSEHRYRTLAAELTEDSLVGVGLTEAYRLLDLTSTKNKDKDRDDPFPGAPVAVAAGSGGFPPAGPGAVALVGDDPFDPDDEGPDDSDDLAGLPGPASFCDPPPATGLLEEDGGGQPPMPTGPLEVEGEPEDVKPPAATAPLDGELPEEQYKLCLAKARHQMECLRAWADWLMGLKVASLSEMWRKHGVAGVVEDIDLTIERLRWVQENLEW
jgi:hypothetical protein